MTMLDCAPADAPAQPDVELPTLAALGTDLLTTSRRQRWVTLGRPFIALGTYVAIAILGWWPLAPIAVFGVFVAVVTATHDVVHRGLGLSRRATDGWLFILGALLGASGHSYRASHLQHHRVFPGPDDPEGDPARMSFWQAILHGPTFLPRLWWWSLKRAGTSTDRTWLVAEAAVPVSALLIGIVFWPNSFLPHSLGLLGYLVMVVNGSWVFPLMTVHLPHRDYGDTPLTQTHTVRDPIVSRVFLELTYHLEHHLYPQVPTHHLTELANRLEPFLADAGVEPQRLFFRRDAGAD